MKRIYICMMSLLLLFFMTACNTAGNENSNDVTAGTTAQNREKQSQNGDSSNSNTEYVVISVGTEDIRIRLADTTVADSLSEILPLELEFSDYNQTEKIAYLPEKLTTAEDDFGVKPSVGDVCLYEPWGNICIFYKDFSYSEDLAHLGRVEDGMDILASQNENFIGLLKN